MFKNAILIIILLQSIEGLSQYAVKGIVKDYSSAKNIYPASVIIDTSYNTNFKNRKYLGASTTTKNGEFEIDNISEDRVNLILNFIGFETMIIENINLDSNQIVDIGNVEMLLGKLCAGFECKDGIVKNRNKKVGKFVKLRYPKGDKKIRIKVQKYYILINYDDII